MKNVVLIRTSKGGTILMMFSFSPRFLFVTRSPPSEDRGLLSELLDQPISTTITYPIKYWCILQKYIFQPLLLLQSIPYHHIVSAMFLQPNRPQMHANSASRATGASQLLNEVKWFLLFPTMTEAFIIVTIGIKLYS